jgi:hypothetical protein
MREIRLSGSEGGGTEFNRFSLPLSPPQGEVNSPLRRVATLTLTLLIKLRYGGALG